MYVATRKYIVLDAFIVGAFDICLTVLCFVGDKLIRHVGKMEKYCWIYKTISNLVIFWFNLVYI